MVCGWWGRGSLRDWLFPVEAIHPISGTDFGICCSFPIRISWYFAHSSCFGRTKNMMWGHFWLSQFLWQDGFVYIFGGWNGDSQFNDLLLNCTRVGTICTEFAATFGEPIHLVIGLTVMSHVHDLWVPEVHAWRWEQRLVRCRSQLGRSPLEHVCPVGRGTVIWAVMGWAKASRSASLGPTFL